MAIKYNVTKEIFSKRLKELMNDNNETTYSIGEVLNLSAATISRYADGKMAPKITTIYSMATHFNVNPVWLMGYDVEKMLEKPHYIKSLNLSKEETTLLENYNKLDTNDKTKVIDYTDLLSNQDKYKSANKSASEITATTDNVVELDIQSSNSKNECYTLAAHDDDLNEETKKRNLEKVKNIFKQMDEE